MIEKNRRELQKKEIRIREKERDLVENPYIKKLQTDLSNYRDYSKIIVEKYEDLESSLKSAEESIENANNMIN